MSGTHKGLKGKIVAMSDPQAELKRQQQMMGEKVSGEIDGEAYVIVELALNESTVGIKRKKLMLMSEKKKMGKVTRKSRSRSRDNNKREDNKKKRKALKWVVPGIIVRVISKKVEGGKLYNKKMRVADVHNHYKFTLVAIEEGGSAN